MVDDIGLEPMTLRTSTFGIRVQNYTGERKRAEDK